MKLLWIAIKQFERGGGPLGVTSDIASMRYRILMPAAELNKRNHQISLASVPDNTMPPGILNNLDCDAVIFSKVYYEVSEKIAAAARARGTKVIFDICDNHFEHPELRAVYRAMATLADAITCNTPGMVEIIKRYSDAPCYVIEDPCEGVRRKPVFAPGEMLRLLWFGHPSNLDGLIRLAPGLKELSRAYKPALAVVSQIHPGLDPAAACRKIETDMGGAIPVSYIPWTASSQLLAFYNADLVIIPTPDFNIKEIMEKRNVKSANRMVESLMAGRMVIANPLPAYEPFREWAWLGGDIAEGIHWAMAHRQEIPLRITAAQDYIEKNYEPEIIGRKWEDVLTAIIAGNQSPQAQPGLRG